MLEAAEHLLDRDGGKGLTLRAAARAAGVSHAAPRHHFGDLTGLLSELAATGFVRFKDQLSRAAADAQDDPRARLIAMGKAYVRFAQQYPGMFLLMFRGDRLDRSRRSLKEASDAAFAVLRGTVGAANPNTQANVRAEAIGSWALVHGFAMLLIDRQLPPDLSPDDVLDTILSTRRGG